MMPKFSISVCVLAAACLAAGCTTLPSLGRVMERLNQEYAGRSVGDFFQNYGNPAGDPTVTDDGKTYLWGSIQPQNGATQGAPSMHVSPNGQIVFPAHTSRNPSELFCLLTIETDHKGIIRSLAIARDSEGEHSNSRCSELLGME